MTIYNVTKVIQQSTVNAIRQYLNVDKVTVLYSDWGNEFGIKCNPKAKDTGKIQRCKDLLWNEYKNVSLLELTTCPKIDARKANEVRRAREKARA